MENMKAYLFRRLVQVAIVMAVLGVVGAVRTLGWG